MKATQCAVLAVVLPVMTVGALAAQRDVTGVRGDAQRAVRPESRVHAGLGAVVLQDGGLDQIAERIQLTDQQQGRLREWGKCRKIFEPFGTVTSGPLARSWPKLLNATTIPIWI